MAQENKFQCSGNCLNCLPAQRAYCASQHSYSNMRVLDALMKEVLDMKQGMDALAAKIDAIQSNEAAVFCPDGELDGETSSTIAANGVGENEK